MATPETPLPFFFIYELSLSSNETQKKKKCLKIRKRICGRIDSTRMIRFQSTLVEKRDGNIFFLTYCSLDFLLLPFSLCFRVASWENHELVKTRLKKNTLASSQKREGFDCVIATSSLRLWNSVTLHEKRIVCGPPSQKTPFLNGNKGLSMFGSGFAIYR